MDRRRFLLTSLAGALVTLLAAEALVRLADELVYRAGIPTRGVWNRGKEGLSKLGAAQRPERTASSPEPANS
jgi:hypothetical protein